MNWLIKSFTFLLVAVLSGGLVILGGLIVAYLHFQSELPSTEALRDVRLQVPLRVYTRSGELIAEFGEKRRLPLAYDQIPERVQQAFLAAEDDRYFQHPGVDYQGILRAATQLALTGERRQGGSTITMQVARNFFLTREKTFSRKLKEVLLALRIERELSKEEILELYLNKIYLGNRAYGVGAAAQIYYGKRVDELDLAQTAMIAGLPKAPSRFNPIVNPLRAMERRDYVLARMAKVGFISSDQQRAAADAPRTAHLHTDEHEVEASYVAEMVRAQLVMQYGKETAYTGGLHVFTTIDARLQEVANREIRAALQAYDTRHGYRGAVDHLDLPGSGTGEDWAKLLANKPTVGDLIPGLVVAIGDTTATVFSQQTGTVDVAWQGLAWARAHRDEDRRGTKPKRTSNILSPGDVIYLRQTRDEEGSAFWRLAQVPAVEGALVALNPKDGAIQALVGGYDFFQSKFNRATQAKRQPGSGFKAFIYSAAMEAGYTPASIINDAPLVLPDPSLKGGWRPQNYSRKFYGPTRLRVGLMKSRNLVSIRLLRAIGVKHALQHSARFGFDPDSLTPNLSLALGTGEVTPLEMARGYAVFANGGFLIDPYFIDRVEEDHAKSGVLMRAEPHRVTPACTPAATEDGAASVQATGCALRTLSPENQYLTVSMMQDVIKRGTAKRALALGRDDLAGKTGTTNDQRDAWFNGFNPDLVTIVWVGFDSFKPLGKGEVGGRAALPAWIKFMREGLREVPDIGWEQPEGIISVRIDPNTGRRVSSEQENAVFEFFPKDYKPVAVRRTPTRSSEAVAVEITEDLF